MDARCSNTGRALIVVDYQNDFVTGSLPVKGAGDILKPMIDVLENNFWDLVVASQDWHPADHISFKKWPNHCVAGTPGAEFYEGDKWQEYVNLIVRKGYHSRYEALSAFNDSGDCRRGGLASLLKHKGITDVYLCGVALDVCVLQTAFDAFHQFKTFILMDLCRAVKIQDIIVPTDGIHLITSTTL